MSKNNNNSSKSLNSSTGQEGVSESWRKEPDKLTKDLASQKNTTDSQKKVLKNTNPPTEQAWPKNIYDAQLGLNDDKEQNDQSTKIEEIRKRIEPYYEGGIEELDGPDQQNNSYQPDRARKSFAPKYSKSQMNIAEQFNMGNNSDAIKKIEKTIDYTRLEIPQAALIKNQMDQMQNNLSKEKMVESSEYLEDVVEVSLTDNSTTQEKRKYLESLGKLFNAIKQGFEKGFEKVAHSLNFAFEAVKSLGKSKVTVITDQRRR